MILKIINYFIKPFNLYIRKYKIINKNIDNIIFDKTSNIENLSLNIRIPSTKKKLTIGKNCIINGNFIFESERGEINIGDRSFIGGGSFICIDKIIIGNDVMVSWGCTLIDNDAHSLLSNERIYDVLNWKKGIEENKIGFYKEWQNVKHGPILIDDNAWIGFNSIILKGVKIGKGAVIGAGSVVARDIPDYAVAAGNPAKIIKYTT